jgi:hypothetical protein
MKGKMHQHKHPRAAHAKGGKAEHPMEGDWAHDEAPSEVYAGAGSNVVKEAKEKKSGGRAKRKHGGMAVHGAAAKKRADRSARKSGGRAGSDKNPLSSAASGKEPSTHHSYEAIRT